MLFINYIFDYFVYNKQMNNQILKVPPQHQKDTQQLMELFHISIEQAYHYLQSFGFNLQTAIHQRFDQFSQPQNRITNLPKMEYNYRSRNPPIDLTDNQDRVVNQIRRRNVQDLERKKYQKTYIIKKNPKIRKRRAKKGDVINLQSDSKEKIEEQFNFKNSLDKLIQGETHVTFQQQISQAFQLLWKQKPKMVALHCIKFIEPNQLMPPFKEFLEFTKIIYSTTLFVETFNKEFINFGLDPSKFDYRNYEFLKDLVSQSDSFYIVLLRYNERSQKIQKFKKLPFSQTFKPSAPQQFLRLTKQIKQQYSKLLYNERYREEISESQKKKIAQDRILKEQQQQQYFKQLNSQLNVEEPIVPAIKQQDLSQIRKINRDLLPKYSQDIKNAINLKVRLPNSEALYFHLPRQETLQYLFKWIENSQQNELGFEDQINRKFDIILPLQRISLLQRKLQKLSQIFGESDMETLVVKQI